MAEPLPVRSGQSCRAKVLASVCGNKMRILPARFVRQLDVSETGTGREKPKVMNTDGAVTLENDISRSGYDWGCDTFFFRLSKRGERFEVEEGCEVDPNLDFCVSSDLENLQEAWRQKLAKGLNQALPKNRVAPKRPRM